MSSEMHLYKMIPYWVENYGHTGLEDKRAVETFIDCEHRESLSTLKAELIGLSAGKYNFDTADLTIGVKRRVKHGSYETWAKLMLQWIAGYKG